MRKILLLLFAALAVAIIPGREISAVSASSDQGVSLNRPSTHYAFGLPNRPSTNYAFGLPNRPSTN
jgi:hypothetical protein